MGNAWMFKVGKQPVRFKDIYRVTSSTAYCGFLNAVVTAVVVVAAATAAAAAAAAGAAGAAGIAKSHEAKLSKIKGKKIPTNQDSERKCFKKHAFKIEPDRPNAANNICNC
uniref:Uncharacterized protein n=1 Tax=Glossina austeni TaxID=7395 RepID=A0A1A9V1I4_GLOAU